MSELSFRLLVVAVTAFVLLALFSIGSGDK